MMFKFWLFLAKLGMFRTDGILAMAPRWWPRARVKYDDGHTYPMPIGNCWTHAKATGGEVVCVQSGDLRE